MEFLQIGYPCEKLFWKLILNPPWFEFMTWVVSFGTPKYWVNDRFQINTTTARGAKCGTGRSGATIGTKRVMHPPPFFKLYCFTALTPRPPTFQRNSPPPLRMGCSGWHLILSFLSGNCAIGLMTVNFVNGNTNLWGFCVATFDG